MGVISTDLREKPIGWSRWAMHELEHFWRGNDGTAELWEPVFLPYDNGYCHVDLDVMTIGQLSAFSDLLRSFAESDVSAPPKYKETIDLIVDMIQEVAQSKCPH